MQGDYRALRIEATRAAFVEFVPGLIDGLAHAEEPDDAVTAFDRFLQALQRGGRLISLLEREPRPGRAGGAGPGRGAAARRHAGAPAADHGWPDRSALLRRDAGPEGIVRAAGGDAAGRGLLRRFPRPPAPVRAGEPVPDRHAHPLRHGLGAAGERGLCRRRRGHRPHRARPRHRSVRRPVRPDQGAGDRDPRDGPARQPRDDGVLRSRSDPALRFRPRRSGFRRRALAARRAIFRPLHPAADQRVHRRAPITACCTRSTCGCAPRAAPVRWPRGSTPSPTTRSARPGPGSTWR